jgi:hypothetical protein
MHLGRLAAVLLAGRLASRSRVVGDLSCCIEYIVLVVGISGFGSIKYLEVPKETQTPDNLSKCLVLDLPDADRFVGSLNLDLKKSAGLQCP